MLNSVLLRLFNGLSNEENPGPIYNSISAFLDFLNLLTGSGLENFNLKASNDADMPDEEKSKSAQSADQNVVEEKMGIDKEPLRRSIFIRVNQLKDIFQLDGEMAKESPLTKMEKIIEVWVFFSLEISYREK